MVGFKVIGSFFFLCIVNVLSLSVIDKFVYKSNNTKCCKTGYILSNTAENDTYECVVDLIPISALEVTEVLVEDTFGKSQCIDIAKDINEDTRKVAEMDVSGLNVTYIDLHYFPKCCPLNLVYDPQKHRCVNMTHINDTNIRAQIESFKNNTNNMLLHIKYGLRECDVVISDHELSSVNFNEELGLYVEHINQTIDYGAYCIDNIYNKDAYVIRVCHKNFDICKKKKLSDADKLLCVRKCCIDGESYNIGHKCTYDYEHGLAFGNESTLIKPEDPYAIIPGTGCRKYMANKSEYSLNEVGGIPITPEDNPSLVLSPFKHTYCYEHAKTGSDNEFHLFLCFLSRRTKLI